MRLYVPLVMILLVQGSYCDIDALSYSATNAVSQHRKHNPKQTEWKVITALSDQAYAEYDRNNKDQSRKLFAEAADHLEAYVKKYETEPARLSYLRVLVRLGALHQNADNLNQARIVFEQCERHSEFNASYATLRVLESGREVKETIANYVKAQLCFLTTCSKPEYKAAHDVVRITAGGSSRGDEIAPPFTLPNRKLHRRKRIR